MIRSPLLQTIAAFGLAVVLSAVTAGFLAVWLERRSVDAVQTELSAGGMGWVEVSADGLQVILAGTATNEAWAFRAAQRAAAIVDADRIVSRIEVAQRDDLQPPRFSVDILRARDGIQVIGLVPAAVGVAAINDAIAAIADGVEVANLVETADFAVPEQWEAALVYGLSALQRLPRSKVTIYADLVEVQAIAESAEQRAGFLLALEQDKPEGVQVVLDISAPRPVMAPFALRFTRDEAGGRLETCAADTPEARDRILAAAVAAGARGGLACPIALGVPSPQWADGVVPAIRALAELGAGTVAFSDADVTLIAAEGIAQDDFDRVMGELANALPDVFSLSGVLTLASEGDAASAGPARLIATLDAQGQMRLRGRLPEGAVGRSVEAYARALFGLQRADIATRAVDDLPPEWALRAMVGLDALSRLTEGTMTLEPETLMLRGRTGNPEAEAEITRVVTNALGQTADVRLSVSYLESLDPVVAVPSPEECVARIDAIQREGKITFDPGSVEINARAGAVLDRIAEVLPECRHVRMEIAGHTDSQGREQMNLNLSQSRADAVLNGLLARNVLVSNLVAQGYGHSQPIAPNDTNAGREQNRRIEFRLLSPASDDTAIADDAPETAPVSTGGTRPVARPRQNSTSETAP
jgi:OOP family OmpA-OmpF porin